LRLRGLELDWARYRSQLDGILEFYASWTPYIHHRLARARVEELAAARKALRDFPAYQGQEGLEKSSLDGAREHVIRQRSRKLYQSNLKDNEWLDAIGVVKRFGGGYAPFDSTLDVAALPYVRGQERRHPEAIRRYQRFLRDHEIPEHTWSLLYRQESRQIFEEDEVDQSELQEIRQALDEPRPPYYGFLVGDGDRMGKAIGKLEEIAQHQEFSRRLSGFAERAREIVQDGYRGCPIYCGGDDVLALLPLDTALDCAQAVNAEFCDSMREYGVTFSAGIVVAHALEPLSEVREWAREAENTAKDEGGRDALCVSVYPRSGAPTTVCGKWDRLPKLLARVVELYLDPDKNLSFGVAHEFRDLAERTREWPELHPAIPELALAIARRKACPGEAVNLVRDYAVDWNGLHTLYLAMLAARPFARARKEASDGALGADRTPRPADLP
jgi:CRISPR-associated protein Cmr2